MANELGVFLERLRGKKSLREVAEKSGLSHTYIRDLELGVNRVTKTPIRPTPETLKKLSDAYHFPYEDLMKVAGYIEERTKESQKETAEQLLEYLELELTNEEIKERMTFKVDNMTLTDDEMDEFISFVRWQRSKKKEQHSASKSDEH